MSKALNSFDQFNYGLRPCKQIERKIMIQVLLRLAKVGYDISEYTYLGFGSPYYIDFVMFHKFLFIDDMICLERSDVPKRMDFNKPYEFVKLHMCSFLNYIPKMKESKHYLVWVDYDRALDQDMLADLKCLKRMASGSVFIITIDARPKLPEKKYDVSGMSKEQREEITLSVYQQWFSTYLDEPITPNDLTVNGVASLFYRVTSEGIRRVLDREGLQFHQLFNVLYADGAQMLTIGGLIGDEEDGARLQGVNPKYIRPDEDYLEIEVPLLTAREKIWLDTRIKKNPKMKARDIAFEIDQDLLDNYCAFYKEYPTYTESLV